MIDDVKRSWKKKFKGDDRGGAWIYTHPDARDGRAVVVNGYGASFNGQHYSTLEDAQAAALSKDSKN